MTETDQHVLDAATTDLPISSIADGWSLKDGSLHLHVRCLDGVTRTLTIDTPRSRK